MPTASVGGSEQGCHSFPAFLVELYALQLKGKRNRNQPWNCSRSLSLDSCLDQSSCVSSKEKFPRLGGLHLALFLVLWPLKKLKSKPCTARCFMLFTLRLLITLFNIYFSFFSFLCVLCVCVSCVCTLTQACIHEPWYTCRIQRTAFSSQFSPSIVWVPGTEVRAQDSAANTIPY